MDDYDFGYFLLSDYVNGKGIVLYTHKLSGAYLVTHETTGSKVIHSRKVESWEELEKLRDEMNHALCTRGAGAAYELGVKYVTNKI